jgi:CheY-like chemotaxis protein
MNRELLRAMLEMNGYDIEEAENGLEAVEKASTAQPAVILMDVRMPQLDGIAALAKLRENPATSSIPVIAITAFAMEGDRNRMEAAGFDGYIAKPVTNDALVDALRKVTMRPRVA